MSGEKTTYQYDFKGNLVGERVYNTLSYTYANQLYEINNNFDEDGNIIKNALQTHVGTLTTNYAYDAESGLPSSVTLFGGRQVEYDYDAEGVLTRRILSTNTDVNELFSYDENGLISTHKIGFITESENAETGEIEEEFVGDEYTYTYDENYNITEIKKGDTVQQSYGYDALNQLIKESDSETGKIATYTYDGYGNITSKTEYAYTEDGTLGEPVDVINYAYDSVWKDKLTSYDGQSISYDEIGNPTDYMGADMTWFGRQMMSYSKNGTNISYTYDADGLRTSKTVNGVKHNYYYVDGQLRYERNGDNYEIYYTYDADGRPVLATKRDLVAKKNYQYYLITNTRGDVIETRNGDGNVNAKFVYDAWGKLIAVTNASGTPLASDSFAYQISLKYRGYVYDNETGLYYLQSRYYDPETGRFLNADDVEYIGYSGEQLSYNAFAYCENNPVNNSDPSGNYVVYYDTLYQKERAQSHYFYNYLIYLNAVVKGGKGTGQIINGQAVSYVSKMKYGCKTLSYNGCEIIAIYNALKLLNKKPKIYDIIYHSETNGGLWADGLFGTFPYYIPIYMKSFGVKTKSFTTAKSIDKKRESGQVYIVVFNHTVAMLHAVAIKSLSNGKIRVYNIYNKRTTYKDYSSVSHLIKSEGNFMVAGYRIYL